MSTRSVLDHSTVRRSANFQPSIWQYDYIQSLKSEYVEETFELQSNRLKDEARMMLCQVANLIDQLELIDVLQRLGVGYHFNNEIRNILESLYNTKDAIGGKNLHFTALEFRIFRQYGYDISTEAFNEFQDGMGNFRTSLSHDIKGMLSLYEASFLSFEDETIMDKARDFASIYLKKYDKKKEDNDMSLLVGHALEIPLQWRTPRLEARWFIDVYEQRHDKSEALLKLAKLDFNMVQVIHQEDLKHSSRWWQRIGLGKKLSFARDRLMENFFWTVGLASQPHFGIFRREITKVGALITTVDDIYDVYGTLEELELFTDAVDRWDINAVDSLPDYIKLCFLALYNSINEMAFNTLKEKEYLTIPELKKGWADLCKAYMKEAKWYFSGYTPTLQEYMENAWISIGAPVILFHAYFLTANPIMKDLDHLEELPPIIQYSSVILRLADDLGTSKREMEVGDVPKSIQCYMNESGASEENAREHVKSMISETWKKMNKEMHNCSFSQCFVEIAMNLARMAQCMYEHGDGHTWQDAQIKDRILSLLVKSIPIV